jgi:hypothetical protein
MLGPVALTAVVDSALLRSKIRPSETPLLVLNLYSTSEWISHRVKSKSRTIHALVSMTALFERKRQAGYIWREVATFGKLPA